MIIVDAYGAWGAEAMESSCLASHLATSSNEARAAALNSLYGRLNLNLVKSNDTAMLSIDALPPTCRPFRLKSYIYLFIFYVLCFIIVMTFYYYWIK